MTHRGVGLEVRGLTVGYLTEDGVLEAVRELSLSIAPAEIYGLVGESGCGKTTLARALVRHLPAGGRICTGSVMLDGTELLELSGEQMRRVWGCRIAMVHQDPSAAVNPSMMVGEQIAEVARAHLGLSRAQAAARAVEMLGKMHVGDPAAVARRYAHQLSGGQLQRVLIAAALITNPRLLIMDEPTTALDVTTEAAILDLVRELLAEYRSTVLYITHNLGVVARLCDRVGVMYAGQLLEEGAVRVVFAQPLHPYTLGLLGSVPRADPDRGGLALRTIPGHVPRPGRLPPGCVFAPRCPGAEEACSSGRPALRGVRGPADGGESETAGGAADGAEHRTACRRWPALRAAPEQFVSPPRRRRPGRGTRAATVLEARGLSKHFPVSGSGLIQLLRRGRLKLRAVDDVSLRVHRGLTLGVVGESGCGKTTLARCIAGLERADSGDLELEGRGLHRSVSRRPRSALLRLQMVFQNPEGSLNPQLTVGAAVGRPLALLGLGRAQARRRVRELFEAVNLPPEHMRRLPHELSGGEKQRVAIARALATDPALMICDEPVSSLDVSVQASLLNLLQDLQDSRGVSYLFISHDLAAVLHLSDWIAVIYLGRLWEIGPAREVFAPPQHPYTEALLSALPVPDPEVRHAQKRVRLRGSVTSAVDIPAGCRFHPRCPRKIGAVCETREPPWREHGRSHRICCHIPVQELAESQKGGGG